MLELGVVLVATLPKEIWRCSVRIGVLRNFTKLTGKHLCKSLVFNKVADLRPETSLKKRLLHRCFPVYFMKFLRTPFLQTRPDNYFCLLF